MAAGVNRSESNRFEIRDYLDAQRKEVDAQLDTFLPPAETHPRIVHEAMRYSVFAGGKRVRPILAVATGEAVEGDREIILYLACALELIHTYSLIHDDLPAMDDDDYRRGNLTCHRKYGEGIAILAGNGLMTHAFRLLTEIPENGEMQKRKLAVLNRLCTAIGTEGGVIAGQVLDLTTQGKEYTAQDVEYIHQAKTGAFIQASVSCSAQLSGVDSGSLRRFETFGARIGLAFQIVDDVLDLTSTTADLGKTPGKDLAEEKATYPALFGISESRRMATQLVEEAILEIGFLGERGEKLAELARFISVRRF
jgi:geranylgeranyl diphosphate synthase type II